jgi:ankyrin repeat protein
MHIAAARDNLKMVKLIESYGGDPLVKNFGGDTALDIAI